MAVHYSGFDISMVAAEDLTGMQYRYVCQASDTTCQMLNAYTDIPLGILQNAPDNGETAIVRILGTSKLVMNAAVAVASFVKAEFVSTADNGKGDAADKGNDVVCGQVVKAAGAENDVGGVLIVHDSLSSTASASASPSASVSASPSASVSASPS